MKHTKDWMELHQITIEELIERAGGLEKLKQSRLPEVILYLTEIQTALVKELTKSYYQVSLIPPTELTNLVIQMRGGGSL